MQNDNELTRKLLVAGLIAGPFYVLVGVAQILSRDGFDVRRHALSLLSNGRFGWVQIGNFLVTGSLVLLGAAGMRRWLHPGKGGTWGPLLTGIYGVGLIGAGIFSADPGNGFPPGTPSVANGISTSGLLHFVFGGIGFYALIAACFVFARRFAAEQRRAWAVYSIFSGVFFFLAFAAIASGSKSSVTILTFYAAVAWIWGWHAALSATLLRETL
jgi:hypothetical protein